MTTSLTRRVKGWSHLVALAVLAASLTVLSPQPAHADDPAPEPASSATETPSESPSSEPSAEPPSASSAEPSSTPPSPTPDSTTPAAGPVSPRADKATAAADDTTVGSTEAGAPQTSIQPASDSDADPTAGAVTAQVSGVARVSVDEDGSVKRVWPETGDGATVKMTVSATKLLRGRQQLDVSWSGAHPTGGILDPISSDAAANEYPFVLLQCRGVDTAGAVPDGQVRLTPQTCWTQTYGERTIQSNTKWPAWRSDRYAATADRYRWANSPYDPLSDIPPACPDDVPEGIHWLPFQSVDGTSYPGTPYADKDHAACGGSPPEATYVDPIGLPSNTTYATTRKDGTGDARFTVWSSKENASLGCSADVKCALVAVPIVGVSCDEWGHGVGTGTGLPPHEGGDATYSSTHAPSASTIGAATRACSESEDQWSPGVARGRDSATNPAVAGNLWWSASNWRNRITVPLEFAVSPDVCSVVSHDVPESLFGSFGFTEAAQSWQPKFCTTDSLFSFTHVQSPDSNARTLLNSGSTSLALTTQGRSGGYEHPVGRAPVAMSGFAIAFNADDKQGLPITHLKLNARLLAKLLTESYSAKVEVQSAYRPPAGSNFDMSKQPLSLLLDPEFKELNPEFDPTINLWRQDFPAPAALLITQGDADAMWALTSYINEDPDAHAWLSGGADPWGMKVNPNYENISLPVQNWPLLDNWANTSDPCAIAGTPYLPLIHNQLGSLSSVEENLQFAKPGVKTECEGSDHSGLYKTLKRQDIGSRFVVGLVPLSGAIRYGLRTAALESSDDHFVEADEAGLKAASALLKEDTETRGWTLDYAALHTAAADTAYPGLMPIYADVATQDLEPETAKRLANFLCYAATDGQRPGSANGQLPAGYLPITATNGLGAERQQTLAVAAAVRAQAGAVPALGSTSDEATACPSTPGKSTDTSSSKTSSSSSSNTDTSATTATTSAPAPAEAAGASDLVASGVNAKTVGQESVVGTIGPLFLVMLLAMSAVGGLALRWGHKLPDAAEASELLRDSPYALRDVAVDGIGEVRRALRRLRGLLRRRRP